MKIFGVFALIFIAAGFARADYHCDGKGSYGKTDFSLSVDVKDDGTEEGLSAKVVTTTPQGVAVYPDKGEENEKTAAKFVFEGDKVAELLKSLEDEHNSNQEFADFLEKAKTNDPEAKAPPVTSTWSLIKGAEVESAVIYSVRPSDPMGAVRVFTMKDKSVVGIFSADFVTPVVCAKPEEQK